MLHAGCDSGIEASTCLRCEMLKPLKKGMYGKMCTCVQYELAEPTIGAFGGNSNWRGPIWFPINYLLIKEVSHMQLAEQHVIDRNDTRYADLQSGISRNCGGSSRRELYQ